MPFENKIPVGILGATGMVGQCLIRLLENHPWFRVAAVAASSRSAGKTYAQSVENRWTGRSAVPKPVRTLPVWDALSDTKQMAETVEFAFCALATDKETIRRKELEYARSGVPVLSCNSAHRLTEDVPMIIPEVNPGHIALIDTQRKNRGWNRGFIVVKPNCSIQSFVPVLHAFHDLGPEKVIVSTYQSVSGAGRTLEGWPEMKDNVIPFIPGEEEKTEKEPLKIWGTLSNGHIVPARRPVISSTCVRVPVTDGHLVTVHVAFSSKPARNELIERLARFPNPLKKLNLPSAPDPFLTYLEEDDRPQTALDRLLQDGMGIGVGRFREDTVLQWKFVALSHNTIRGAGGGSLLTAELLARKGYLPLPDAFGQTGEKPI